MSQKDDLLRLLSDGKPHSNFELADISFRFGALLHTLRKEGYRIETIKDDNQSGFSYRLVSVKQEVK